MDKGGCQIAVRCSVIRVKGELLFKLLDCVAGLPFLQQSVAQMEVRRWMIRKDANGSIQMIHRFIELTCFSEGKAEGIVGVGGLRPEIESPTELSNCFVGFTPRNVKLTQAIVRVGVVFRHG